MALPVKLLLCAFLVAYIGYSIHKEPLPEGYSHPWKAKTLLFIASKSENIAGLASVLGISSKPRAIRFMHDHLASVFSTSHGDLQVDDATFDGVPVRIYRSKSIQKPTSSKGLPAVMFYHGGGCTIGSITLYEPITSYIADKLGAVVISVGYRLAPEHTFPAAFDDCATATRYLVRHHREYGVDPARVVLAGDSAGGNLAATVSLKLRDEGFQPQPKLQVLIYPSVQKIDLKLPSYQQNSMGPLLALPNALSMTSNYAAGNDDLVPYLNNNTHVDPAVRKAMAESYLNHKNLPSSHFYPPYSPPDLSQGDPEVWGRYKDVLLNPYMAPLLATHHRDLPEAYIFTAQYDILRDEGFLYAKRLRDAGVKVTHQHSDIGFHGIINFFGKFPEATEVLNNVVDFLKKNM